MKIGEFAKLHSTPIPTIRLYIDRGILIPKKNGSQYDFELRDHQDMEKVLSLKSCGFSLKEINNYINALRMYDTEDNAKYSKLIPILRKKEKKLIAERQCLDMNLQLVTSMIAEHEKNISEFKENYNEGIHTDFLDIFACPKCGQSLRLEKATIVKSNILAGELICSCGYHARIENGLFLVDPDNDLDCDSEFFTDYFGDDETATYDSSFFEIIDGANPDYLSLESKAREWINDALKERYHKNGIMLLPDIASLFLYLYNDQDYFDDSLIVLTGLSRNSMQPMREHLQRLGTKLKIATIISPDCSLPFASGTINCLIDYLGSYSYSFYKPTPYMTYINKYLSDSSLIVGSLDCYPKGSRTSKKINDTYRNSVSPFPGYMDHKKLLSSNGYIDPVFEYIGSTKDPAEYFEYHVMDDTRSVYAFSAVRKNR